MATRRFVCDGCQSFVDVNVVSFGAGEAPTCKKCQRPMRLPKSPDRPPDDYTRMPGIFYKLDPLRTIDFEKLMRRAFGSESGIAGYAEV